MILTQRLAPPNFSRRLAPSIIAAVLLLAAAPAAQGAPARERWSPLGPTGGTITALAVAPGAGGTLDLAAARAAALYATTADGVFRPTSRSCSPPGRS